MGHFKVGGIPHAVIATLICVGCIALKDYRNDNFLLFSAIYVDQLFFSFWMSICLPAYVRVYACALHLSLCVCYVSTCVHVMHLSILMFMCVQACDDNLWMFLFTPLPHHYPPSHIYCDFFRTDLEIIHLSCMNGD